MCLQCVREQFIIVSISKRDLCIGRKEEKEDIIIYIDLYVSGWCVDYWFLLF